MRSFTRALAVLVALGIAIAAHASAVRAHGGGRPAHAGGKVMAFTLTSSSFAPDGAMPARHTSDGADVSPPLAWSGAPAGTKSFALVVDDPDAPDPAAPRVVWVHWVLYDIPAGATGLPERVTARTLPPGTREGRNDWKQTGWRGPSPPVGRHRYVHTLYALDTLLPDLGEPDKPALLAALHGHVLGTARLVGTYQRK